MKFDIITIFPQIFDSYFSESILVRAQKNKLIKIKIHNLRDYTTDKHQTVDDTPYGGGAGMVMKVEPIYRALGSIISNFQFLPPSRDPAKAVAISNEISNLKFKKPKKTRIILFSAKGKRYTQKDAVRLAKYDNLIFVCGRYEGVDERVAQNLVDEEISIGDYVLTGGEIPAMILIDSISRLLLGVLGNSESAKDESHNSEGYLEYPQYTKPEIFSVSKKKWKVPKVLLSGNHKKIEEWRKEQSKTK